MWLQGGLCTMIAWSMTVSPCERGQNSMRTLAEFADNWPSLSMTFNWLSYILVGFSCSSVHPIVIPTSRCHLVAEFYRRIGHNRQYVHLVAKTFWLWIPQCRITTQFTRPSPKWSLERQCVFPVCLPLCRR